MRRQHHVAILVALALFDPDHHALAVDVGYSAKSGGQTARKSLLMFAVDDVFMFPPPLVAKTKNAGIFRVNYLLRPCHARHR
jgi:hypothetical protein